MLRIVFTIALVGLLGLLSATKASAFWEEGGCGHSLAGHSNCSCMGLITRSGGVVIRVEIVGCMEIGAPTDTCDLVQDCLHSEVCMPRQGFPSDNIGGEIPPAVR